MIQARTGPAQLSPPVQPEPFCGPMGSPPPGGVTRLMVGRSNWSDWAHMVPDRPPVLFEQVNCGKIIDSDSKITNETLRQVRPPSNQTRGHDELQHHVIRSVVRREETMMNSREPGEKFVVLFVQT